MTNSPLSKLWARDNQASTSSLSLFSHPIFCPFLRPNPCFACLPGPVREEEFYVSAFSVHSSLGFRVPLPVCPTLPWPVRREKERIAKVVISRVINWPNCQVPADKTRGMFCTNGFDDFWCEISAEVAHKNWIIMITFNSATNMNSKNSCISNDPAVLTPISGYKEQKKSSGFFPPLSLSYFSVVPRGERKKRNESRMDARRNSSVKKREKLAYQLAD